MQVEEGSVVVTAGGVKLEEGVDYIVNYGTGKVSIINEGILISGTPLQISVRAIPLACNNELWLEPI